MWLIVLSDQLPVLGLVSHYLANYLMGRGLILRCEASEEVPHFSPNIRRCRGLMRY